MQNYHSESSTRRMHTASAFDSENSPRSCLSLQAIYEGPGNSLHVGAHAAMLVGYGVQDR